MKPTLLFLLGLLAANFLSAQQSGEYIRLVQDFVGADAGANRIETAVSTTTAFYWLEPDLQGGSALWGSDGSYPGTRNINRKLVDLGISGANDLFVFNDRLYLFAGDFRSGDQLLTLGLNDEEATPIAKLDASGKAEPNIVAVGETVFYFTTNLRPAPLKKLWVSDGTPLGTFELNLPDIVEDFSLTPDYFLKGDTLYFSTSDFESVAPVLRYVPATARVETLSPGGEEASEPFNAANLLDGGDRVFLVEGNVSLIPYGDDGPGTALTGPQLARIASSSTAKLAEAIYFVAEDPEDLLGIYRVADGDDRYELILNNLALGGIEGEGLFTTVGGIAYFRGLTPTSGGEQLFSIDGAGNAKQLTSLPGRPDGFSDVLGQAGEKLVFAARRDGLNRDLWITDGSTNGTEKIAELSGDIGASVEVTDGIYFTVGNEEAGSEIYFFDATTDAVSQVTNLSDISATGSLLAFRDELVFRALDAKRGNDWYRTDGSTTGTELIFDLPDSDFGSTVNYIGVDSASGRLLLTAFGRDLAPTLYSTDGTEAGTRRIRTLSPGQNLSLFPQLNGNFILPFFPDPESADHGVAILSGDGSSFRRLNLPDSVTATRFYEFTRAGDLVYFADNTETVWATDGTEAGTRPIFKADERRSEVLGALDFVALGNKITFTAFRNDIGYTRWMVDGLTGEVTELSPENCCERPSLPVSVGGQHLYFVASAESVTLYRFDPATMTEVETVRVFSQLISNTVEVVGSSLYFSAVAAGTSTGRLHRYDAVTSTLTTIEQTTDGTSLRSGAPLAGSDSILYFSSPFSLFSIYRTDGTEAGTWGVSRDRGEDHIVHDDRLYFVVNSDTLGRELYASNGAPDDAYLVDELRRGRETTYPLNFLSTDLGLFFMAISPTLGRELFTLADCDDRPLLVATPSEECGDYVTVNLPASRGEREVTVLEGPAFMEITFFEETVRLRGVPGQKYTVQFSAADQGCGDLGQTFTFRIPDAAGGCDELVSVGREAEQATLGLKAYPNPTSGALTVDITTEQPEAASIWVLDGQGRRVLYREVITGGPATVRLGELPAGVYYLMVEVQGSRVGRTVIRR